MIISFHHIDGPKQVQDRKLLVSAHKLGKRLIHSFPLCPEAANSLGFGQKLIIDLQVARHVHTIRHTSIVSIQQRLCNGQGVFPVISPFQGY